MDKGTDSYEVLLEVNGLWKIFGENLTDFVPDNPDSISRIQGEGAVLAVQNVSFSVRRGEVFVIMGLSGSGKSTLLRCIPRLHQPTRGEVIIDGRNAEMDERTYRVPRHEVAMIFQHYGLLPHRNVLEM